MPGSNKPPVWVPSTQPPPRARAHGAQPARSDDESPIHVAEMHPPVRVLIASILGSPLAGAMVMALNDFRLRNTGAAIVTIVLGAAAAAGLFGAAMVLSVPMTCGCIALAIGLTFVLALGAQGTAVRVHRLGGGKFGAWWKTLLLGFVGMGLVMAPLGVILFVPKPLPGTPIAISEHVEIRYGVGATEMDARRLADTLLSMGLLTNTREEIVVVISREFDRTFIWFRVEKGMSDDPVHIQNLTGLGRELVRRGFGQPPLTLRLCDEKFTVRRELPIN